MGRLIIASNRVGSSVNGNEGGLATAMTAAVNGREVIWFGWSGEVIDTEPGPARSHREGALTRILVDLERPDYEGYYLGFANQVLWPNFHYSINLTEYNREQWATYCRVNELFAARLAPVLKPDDVIWVHDYHLIPL
ncbi:MAG: trehalose-6-phosphate synthase, partial [Alphaproteobacteria bacterium]|nr:trehalose-6-phosphate synthase [Alphaproteobacteria bacterium]